MMVRAVLNNSIRSLRLMVQSASNLRAISKFATRVSLRLAQGVVEAELSGAATNRFANPLSAARVFEGTFYPRQLIEDYTRIVPGATMTHAVLAICGEAMRLYLDKHGELGEAPLRALLEVNVRNAGAHALVGNRIAISQIELHRSIIFPEGRLQAIYSANKELQSTENAESTSFKLRSLYENLPAPILAWLGKNARRQNRLNQRVMGGGNLGLAELEGGDQPLYLLGARLSGFTSISPLYSGCSLMFSASTYADTVCLTFTSDRNMMPDPEFMRECLDQAVNQVQSYLKTKGTGGKTKSKAKPAKPKAARSKAKSKTKAAKPLAA